MGATTSTFKVKQNPSKFSKQIYRCRYLGEKGEGRSARINDKNKSSIGEGHTNGVETNYISVAKQHYDYKGNAAEHKITIDNA